MRETHPPSLPLEQEIAYYVDAYKACSSYVRYVVAALALATMVIFVAKHNSSPESWLNTRLSLARTALKVKVWERGQKSPSTREEEVARAWARLRGLSTEQEVREQVQFLEQLRAEHAQRIQMPVVGATFDINDLGFYGGLTLSVLAIMLSLSLSRQAEVLYLALWKVRVIWKEQGCPDDARSTSNLAYHSLATADPSARTVKKRRDFGLAIHGSWL